MLNAIPGALVPKRDTFMLLTVHLWSHRCVLQILVGKNRILALQLIRFAEKYALEVFALSLKVSNFDTNIFAVFLKNF